MDVTRVVQNDAVFSCQTTVVFSRWRCVVLVWRLQCARHPCDMLSRTYCHMKPNGGGGFPAWKHGEAPPNLTQFIKQQNRKHCIFYDSLPRRQRTPAGTALAPGGERPRPLFSVTRTGVTQRPAGLFQEWSREMTPSFVSALRHEPRRLPQELPVSSMFVAKHALCCHLHLHS